MKIYKDPIFAFYEFFNEENGFLIRTNFKNKENIEESPYKRAYPELIDIGIMGHCSNRTTCRENHILCYQDYFKKNDMSFEDYHKIIDESKGKTFQVALGGRGDPNKHKDFIKILEYTRNNDIVPNLTTSGFNITSSEIDAIIKYCGAVAVSCYSKIINGVESNVEFENVVNYFTKGIITNIHYVISKYTIDDAIIRLETNMFPKGINSVVFLLYKPVGAAKEFTSECIIEKDKLDKFFDLLINRSHPFKVGFDSCFSIIVKEYYDNNKFLECIQPCESGRFSCYISSDMKMYPCSFAQQKAFECDLNCMSIKDAWFDEKLKSFVKLNKCNNLLCPLRLNCYTKKVK